MMKIKTLRMTNFRGFEAASIDFDPHMTCIIGVNGSGKTTVLNAVDRSMLAFLVENKLVRGFYLDCGIYPADARKMREPLRLDRTYTTSTKLDFEIDGDAGFLDKYNALSDKSLRGTIEAM